MKNSRLTFFMMAVFVASIVLLGLKLLNSVSFTIVVEGGESSIIPISGFYTLNDVMIVAVLSSFVGISMMYLLLSNLGESTELSQVNMPDILLEERKNEWKKIAISLKDNTQKVYETILESDGIILQSELIEKTGFSKTKVTRCLDDLELKVLIERKRRGMSNIVLLK